MKSLIFLFAAGMMFSIEAMAQRIVLTTDSFIIQGNIRKELIFTLADLDTFARVMIKDQIIYNQKGEPKDTVKNMKGILLKDLLSSVEYLYDKPKQLNEFYFVFTTSDGYRVVFSWNEIYNTEAGNQFYIVTQMGVKTLQEMDERILFISTADLKVGRRYIKGLKSIEVKQLD